MDELTRIVVQSDKELKRKLIELAKLNNRDMSKQVRHMIERDFALEVAKISDIVNGDTHA